MVTAIFGTETSGRLVQFIYRMHAFPSHINQNDSSAKPKTMFHRLVLSKFSHKTAHIPGPMSCSYMEQPKTHIPTYPSMLPSTGCTFYWLWHALLRESCLVLRPLNLATIATCTMASERTTAPLSKRHKTAVQTSYNCVLASLCGLK